MSDDGRIDMAKWAIPEKKISVAGSPFYNKDNVGRGADTVAFKVHNMLTILNGPDPFMTSQSSQSQKYGSTVGHKPPFMQEIKIGCYGIFQVNNLKGGKDRNRHVVGA